LRRILFLLVLWAGAVFAPGAEQASLTVAADSSVRSALKELTQAWANAHNGEPVELELTTDGALREGLEKNSPWDVIILANPGAVKTLTASGALQSAGQKTLARNELIVLGHQALIQDEEMEWFDLLEQEWNSVAMGDPDKVVSGSCAVAAMRTRGADKTLKSAPVLCGDDNDALARAERNEVDAVFLLRSNLPEAAVPGYDTFKVDPADYPPVVYTAALPKNSRRAAPAAAFISFLHSKAGREIWKKWNFSIAD
jgi:molybdate transport system substrate-binding protein